MKIILDVQDNKAAAFLNFVRSLDFIAIKNEAADEVESLPKALQDMLLQSEQDIESGNVFSHDEVMNAL